MSESINVIDNSFKKIVYISSNELTTLRKLYYGLKVLKSNLEDQELKYKTFLLKLKSNYITTGNDQIKDCESYSVDLETGKIIEG